VTRLAFRFASVFLFCLIYPFPFDDTFTDRPLLPDLGDSFVVWIGTHLFHLDAAEVTSSEELHIALQLFTYALVAAASTLLWSLADRRRTAYPRLHAFMRLYARFYLATVLLAFGSAKVFPYQFRPPSLARLLQPLGDYDPHGLLWAFIGSSTAYTVFSGAVEMFAGLLLLIPRLTTIGALVSLAILTNVFALDMSYDVSVRSFCFVLILIAGFLLAPDIRRLADVFIFNRPVAAAPARPLFHGVRANHIATVLQTAVAISLVGYAFVAGSSYAHQRDQALLRNPLRGIWVVEEFTLNGSLRPALVTDSRRWQRIVIDTPAGHEDRPADLVRCSR